MRSTADAGTTLDGAPPLRRFPAVPGRPCARPRGAKAARAPAQGAAASGTAALGAQTVGAPPIGKLAVQQALIPVLRIDGIAVGCIRPRGWSLS